MLDEYFFLETFGKKPIAVITSPIEKGMCNVGVFLHQANFDMPGLFERESIIEKRTIHLEELKIAKIIHRHQKEDPSWMLFPKIYRYEKIDEAIIISMEFVEGVESPALRQDSTAEALATSLAALHEMKFEDLDVPSGHDLFCAHAMRIEKRMRDAGKLDEVSDLLPAFLKICNQALMQVPVVLSHCDVTFENMAYDSVNNTVRFIDFGKMNYNFTGFDFWPVYRYGLTNNYNTDKLIDLYCRKTSGEFGLIKLAAMFASADRCAFRIHEGSKSGKTKAMIREVELLNRIIEDAVAFAG